MMLLELVARLGLAMLAGALVGLERETNDRQAGLRTHMMVCLGSALFTIVSLKIAGPAGDPARIAAQIVTGIGFLGAGTIFRFGSTVRGLTTAAGLWTVAAVGMGIAAGGVLLQLGLITCVLIFGINKWLRQAENRWLRVSREVSLSVGEGHDALTHVMEELSRRGIEVHHVEWAPSAESGRVDVRMRVRTAGSHPVEGLVASLVSLPGVHHVDLD
jgi:putative Mg2+ transporter-C (MgtC) family protein